MHGLPREPLRTTHCRLAGDGLLSHASPPIALTDPGRTASAGKHTSRPRQPKPAAATRAAASQVVVAFAALPTASSCYVLAVRMGGDAAFTAGLVTVSTLLGMIGLPLWLTLAA